MSQRDGKTKDARIPHHVRLPGFVHDDEVGLGDVIKHATYAIGITPCTGCERRAATLNRLLLFKGRSQGSRSIKGGR